MKTLVQNIVNYSILLGFVFALLAASVWFWVQKKRGKHEPWEDDENFPVG